MGWRVWILCSENSTGAHPRPAPAASPTGVSSGRAPRSGSRLLDRRWTLGDRPDSRVAERADVGDGADGERLGSKLARHALFVRSDFPRNWTRSETSQSDGAFPGQTQLANCIGIPTSVLSNGAPSATSPEFISNGDGYTVQDTVTIYRSAKAATADYASLANPKTPSCLASVLNGQAKAALFPGLWIRSNRRYHLRGVSSTDRVCSRRCELRCPASDHRRRCFTRLGTDGDRLRRGHKEQTVVLTSVKKGTFRAPLPCITPGLPLRESEPVSLRREISVQISTQIQAAGPRPGG